MNRETIIGFDSAWAGRNLGAICSVTLSQGMVECFTAPRLVQFAEAAAVIEKANLASDYVLVGLDQPTLVPNAKGIRPVERVAGSIVNKLGGGVQPENRGKEGMFGNAAPVWQFLDRIGARENPEAARRASRGLFLIEVFPALALPSIIPEIWHRKRAAKYNPANRNLFLLKDWQLVANGVAHLADNIHALSIANAARELAQLQSPGKPHQDKLDSLICLLVAMMWRLSDRCDSMVIGDRITGYMVTPVSEDTRPILRKSASRNLVPIDEGWTGDVCRKRSRTDRSQPDPGMIGTTSSQNAPSAKKDIERPSGVKVSKGLTFSASF
jgi:predicted RNase H-like nuclease